MAVEQAQNKKESFHEDGDDIWRCRASAADSLDDDRLGVGRLLDQRAALLRLQAEDAQARAGRGRRQAVQRLVQTVLVKVERHRQRRQLAQRQTRRQELGALPLARVPRKVQPQPLPVAKKQTNKKQTPSNKKQYRLVTRFVTHRDLNEFADKSGPMVAHHFRPG